MVLDDLFEAGLEIGAWLFVDVIGEGIGALFGSMSSEDQKTSKDTLKTAATAAKDEGYITTFVGTYQRKDEEHKHLFTIAQTKNQDKDLQSGVLLKGRLYLGDKHHTIEGTLTDDHVIFQLRGSPNNFPTNVQCFEKQGKHYVGTGAGTSNSLYDITLQHK